MPFKQFYQCQKKSFISNHTKYIFDDEHITNIQYETKIAFLVNYSKFSQSSITTKLPNMSHLHSHHEKKQKMWRKCIWPYMLNVLSSLVEEKPHKRSSIIDCFISITSPISVCLSQTKEHRFLAFWLPINRFPISWYYEKKQA